MFTGAMFTGAKISHGSTEAMVCLDSKVALRCVGSS
jgi:hypothetical protein